MSTTRFTLAFEQELNTFNVPFMHGSIIVAYINISGIYKILHCINISFKKNQETKDINDWTLTIIVHWEDYNAQFFFGILFSHTTF